MKKLLLTLTACASLIGTQAQGVYQIPNSDFENWAADKEPGNGWYSFASARTEDLGSLAGFATMFSPHPTKVTGYNGGYAVQLKTGSVMNANGNLTTGKINMGSSTPSDKANYNFTDLTETTHNLLFAGTPDSVACYAKFTSGGSEYGRGQFILHDEYRYCDPESSNEDGYETHKVALAAIHILACEDWTRFSAAFEYTGTVKPEKQYMLASFTTNPIPGGETTGDILIIDDVKLIYNSQLASLSYGGTPVANFNKDNYRYNIDAAYDESKLACTSNGKGATIDKYYNKETGKLTITVKGDDWSETNRNEHVYTIQFKTPVVTVYTNHLMIDVLGDGFGAPEEKSIQLIEEVDGSYSFLLPDFNFSGTPIGDIKVTNLERTENNDAVTFTGKQTLDIIPVEVNLEATITNGQMIAHITIPAVQGEVYFAPAITVNSTTNIADDLSGWYNVTINRSFPAGWSTICLPFETTVAALGATQAQAFTAFADNVLTFDKVNNGNLKANTPYLIYFEEAKATPAYMPADIESCTPESVTFGDVTFTGNYTAGMSMVGLYGVAEQNGAQYIMKGGAGSTLGSTGAYFTVGGTTAGVNTLSLDIEGEGTTGIGSIVAEEGQAFDVYTLTGVKVRTAATGLDGLQRGIYIVNGKKVLVK